MHLFDRHRLVAAPIAMILMASALATATAQVATLEAPDRSPAPTSGQDASATGLVFVDREEALLAFARCMRDNGIDMDDPEPGSRGRGFFRGGPESGNTTFDVESPEFQDAQRACGPILEAARPEVDPEAEAERLEENLALAQCFREQGYAEYPDPAIGPDGRLQRFRGPQLEALGIDQRSAEFRVARETCAAQLGLEFRPGGRDRQGGSQ